MPYTVATVTNVLNTTVGGSPGSAIRSSFASTTAIALDFDDTRRSRSVGVTVHVAPPTRPSTSKLKSTGKKTTHKRLHLPQKEAVTPWKKGTGSGQVIGRTLKSPESDKPAATLSLSAQEQQIRLQSQ